MIQIAAPLPSATAGPARPSLLAAQSGASNFALALSSLLVARGAPGPLSGEAAAPDAPVAGLQLVAEPGKELPEIGLDLSDEEQAPEQRDDSDSETPAGEELPFAWFALPETAPADAPPSAPGHPPHVAITTRPGRDILLPEPPLPGEAAPLAEAEKSVAPSAELRTAPFARTPAGRPAVAAPRANVRIGAGETFDAPEPIAAPPTTVAAPHSGSPAMPIPAAGPPVASAAAPGTVPIPVAPAVQPPVPVAAPVALPPGVQPRQSAELPAPAPVREAAPATVDVLAPRVQMAVPAAQPVSPRGPEATPLTVASLIAHVAAPGATQPIALSPLRRGFAEIEQPVAASISAPGAAVLQQVAATPDAQQGALDMRRQEWTGKMIDMIEAMRDAAPVKETRISLMPDALGKVDIAVRQEGDRVHVHFTAETQAARQILTDAQGRLNDIAEARGIRLGQTSVDSQAPGAGSGQRQSDAPRPRIPSAPASARGLQDQSTNDERVA
ncbi:MAG: flagellar hook-length control protein FliK [Sphingomonadales bacterium]|nr:MAG: flagellar hook-length control protein FliK [Sphingomonadales bacterium]